MLWTPLLVFSPTIVISEHDIQLLVLAVDVLKSLLANTNNGV